MLSLICYIIALVLFAITAFGVPVPRANLVAAGLFFWLLGQEIVNRI